MIKEEVRTALMLSEAKEEGLLGIWSETEGLKISEVGFVRERKCSLDLEGRQAECIS